MTDEEETGPPRGQPGAGDAQPPSNLPGVEPPGHRPLLERLGMASIALAIAVLFGVVAVASWVGGEVFLAAMAGIGAVMTAWAGLNTVIRG